MKSKQTMRIVKYLSSVVVAIVIATVIVVPISHAVGNNGCETDTSIIKCDNVDVNKDGVENTGVWSILLTAINILTAGIGVVALGGIVYAAILYTSAGGSQEQIKKAMTIITNVVIGVLAFALMYAVLNFLIPGGLFA